MKHSIWRTPPTVKPRRRNRVRFQDGRRWITAEETHPGAGIIISIFSTHPADYLNPALKPGAPVRLPATPQRKRASRSVGTPRGE